MHHSQLMNMSSGSQVLSSSPPLMPLSSLAPLSYQQHRHAVVQPVSSASPPPLHDHAVFQSTSSSPRELSPRQLSLSLTSPAEVPVPVVATASGVHSHRTTSPTMGTPQKYAFIWRAGYAVSDIDFMSCRHAGISDVWTAVHSANVTVIETNQ